MKYDKNHRYRGEAGCISCGRILFIVWAFGFMVFMAGCRSSRKTVADTHREISTSVREFIAQDTLNAAITACEESRDSAEFRSDELTDIRIRRDSAGRITGILASRVSREKGSSGGKISAQKKFHGYEATEGYSIADSTVTLSKEREETSRDVCAGKDLEFVVGMALIGLVALLYLGDYIYRLWKGRSGE